MLVRNAHVVDIDQLLTIEEMCYEHPWPREAFEEEIENGEVGVGMVAEDEGMIVGYLTGMVVGDRFHLHNIAVHLDFRRRGIGRSLIEAAELFCRQNSFRQILLEVREDNEDARSMYLKLGFRAAGMRRDYYGPGQDAHLYCKDLRIE